MSHIKVFESIAYVKVPETRRTKVNDKGEKYIRVGYEEAATGYKLHNPTTKEFFLVGMSFLKIMNLRTGFIMKILEIHI